MIHAIQIIRLAGGDRKACVTYGLEIKLLKDERTLVIDQSCFIDRPSSS